MDTLIIILSVLMFAVAIMIALTVYGLFVDNDKDGIPDALEYKFNDLKEKFDDIKKDIKSLTKTVKPIENFTKDDYFISEMKRIEELKKKGE